MLIDHWLNFIGKERGGHAWLKTASLLYEVNMGTNSWGEGHGDKGHFFIKREDQSKLFGQYILYGLSISSIEK